MEAKIFFIERFHDNQKVQFMSAEELIEQLKKELETLKARLVVDDDMMKHLHEIYFWAFCGWYDPDNEEHEKQAKKVWPHIMALNDKLHFKR